MAIFFAAGVVFSALGWQKRAKLARQLGGYLLGYADSVDCKQRAIAWWRGRV